MLHNVSPAPALGSRQPGFAALDPCVHCGFCLPACPTYLATGDEADSPRGRIVLMRALERGDLLPTDPAVGEHLDACLGCRGCEPVCPAGVQYGYGLETARAVLARARGLPLLARLVLALFARPWRWRAILSLARWLRNAGVATRLAGRKRFGFGMAMVAATRPASPVEDALPPDPARYTRAPGPTVALFRGCVMDELFNHVHEATRRTLEANGYRVVEAPGQVCCGALHAHAGDLETAKGLARENLAAFDGVGDFIVLNSAGCGALLKEYGHLVGAEAAGFTARVRDVAELLADRGPRPGGALPLRVAYDAPCHLQHAQRIHQQPLALLRAIPGLELCELPGADRCCGSAGIYGLLEPGLSRAILEAKLAAIHGASPRPALVATGNPGCLMQIGAGLLVSGLPVGVAHPVELLDWSYRAGGVYGGDTPSAAEPAAGP